MARTIEIKNEIYSKLLQIAKENNLSEAEALLLVVKKKRV